jgi:hypothetical protein
MRVLKLLILMNLFAASVGAVLAVGLAFFNDHPTTLDAWGVSLGIWQPAFWTCCGVLWFIVACAWLNALAPGVEAPDSEEFDSSPDWPQGQMVQVHPVSGNLMSNGVDCDGNMSGSHRTFD